MKVWVFVAQMDGEALGPFVFASKPTDQDIEETLMGWNPDWSADDIANEVYRRQLTEEEVINLA